MRQRHLATWLGVTLLFVGLAIVMMWPLARHPGTLAPRHHDVDFNMWRLRWVAHALRTSPARIFDANIFFPEKDTLAYSDALLVQGVIAAPLLGLNPVLVHNIMMLLPIVGSAVALFALCWYLTGSRGAGIVAGTAFAFAPFRFEHIMHMEMQWTIWMPLAFLALHRLLDNGRWRDGLALGTTLALQTLSCIYYGIFLGSAVAVAAALLFLRDRRADWRRVVPPLAAGALLAVAVSALYSVPYARVHALVGDRPIEEVNLYSAQAANYLNVPVGNWLYGNPGRPGRPERRLYPGAIVTLLAIAGLLLHRPSPRQIAYLIVLAFVFDLSLGFSGFSYPFLSRFVAALRSLRALARLGVFVLMFLSVLAAYGYALIVRSVRPPVRLAICAALVLGMLVEYRTTFDVVAFPSSAPPAQRLLARLPRGIVAEFPWPAPDLVGLEARRQYLSTFHWFPMINGYSGHFPPSYVNRMDPLDDFPSERALRQLRKDKVVYVLIHADGYTRRELDTIHERLTEFGMAELAAFDEGEEPIVLFAIR